jgi:CRISPR-associated endonuclease/helicase Cas3
LHVQESKHSAEANPKPFWYTCMSATPRCLSDSSLHLEGKDLAKLSSKLQAHKAAKIVDTSDKGKLDSILSIIEQHKPQWSRLIIYVEKPADAVRLCSRLQKKYDVRVLTGTMRGLEKRQVSSSLSAFQPHAAPTEPRSVLVCTSAGEVGLNISSDLMITELTFADRLAQRVGRLNRWGEHKKTFVYIVRPVKEKKKDGEQDKYPAAIEATIAYLKSLTSADGWMQMTTNALYTNPIPTEAFSPERPSLSLNEAMIAQLANTSAVSVPVDNFIRGVNVEYNVNLVVRKKEETDALLRMSEDEIQEYVAAVPVQNDEVAKDTAENLKKILSGRGEMLFVSATGEARRIDFGKDHLDLYKLVAGTLYIPEEFNLIDTRGMFSSEGGGRGDIFADVQDKYRRFVRINNGFLCLDTGETIEAETMKELVKAIKAPVGFKPKALFVAESLVYIKLVESKRTVKMTLDTHKDKARETAQEMLRVLSLPMYDSVLNSAVHHDDGKAHWLWQLASRGTRANGELLAKVGYFNDPLLLGGMRHELVSVLNNPELNDLEKWLILSHHGRCRPFFEDKAYDPDRREESAEVNARLPALLEQLTMQYGYWGLAYLEALVRAIDINSE